MVQDGMTSRLVALCFDANEPLPLARFWAEALRWEVHSTSVNRTNLMSCWPTPKATSSA
jgi:hypothetical protein